MNFDFSSMPRVSREALRRFKKKGVWPLKWRLWLEEQRKVDELLREATCQQLGSLVGRDDYGHSARKQASKIIQDYVFRAEAIRRGNLSPLSDD